MIIEAPTFEDMIYYRSRAKKKAELLFGNGDNYTYEVPTHSIGINYRLEDIYQTNLREHGGFSNLWVRKNVLGAEKATSEAYTIVQSTPFTVGLVSVIEFNLHLSVFPKDNIAWLIASKEMDMVTKPQRLMVGLTDVQKAVSLLNYALKVGVTK